MPSGGFEDTMDNRKRMRISRLKEDRWEDFRNLRLESLKREPLAFLSSYEDEVKFGNDIWQSRLKNVLFALDEGEPVGMITFVQRGRKKNEHIADIFGVYVNKRYRRNGLGHRLVRRAISIIQKNTTITKVSLSVSVEQVPAINLYLSNGFKVAGILENEFKVNGKFYDELIMERLLK